MARLMTSAGLLTCAAFAATAGAQTLTFAKIDYPSNSGARAIATADFNRDGWPDVAHANGDRNSVTVLLNHEGSSFVRAFEIPVGAGPFDLTTADFNRDGIPDLAVANADGNSVSILFGRGDGSFTRSDIAAPAANPRGIAAADINGDGKPDIVYTGYAAGTVQVLLGDGTGGFSKGFTYTAPGSLPQGVAIGDFNHDRFPDLAVACNNGSGLRILYGTSAGSFSVQTITGHGNLNVLATGDLNGDGWTDVAAASTSDSDVAVYLGSASGLTFARSYIVGASPRGVTLADVNDDGHLDIVTANRSSSTVSVLAGDRSHPGAFLAHQEFASARGSRALVTGDFDGDGRIDVATGNEYAAALTLLSNATAFKSAAFSFKALTVPSGVTLGSQETIDSRLSNAVPQLAAADFNRDGKIDFVAPGAPVSHPTSVVVMLRDGPTVTLTGPAPLAGFVVDDFNGDGNPDVLYYSADPATSQSITRFVTFLGDGRGHFTASPATVEQPLLEWCAAGDLNRDGRLDLVCDNFVLLGNGNGTFRPAAAFADASGGAITGFPRPQLVDVNRDGKLDLVSAAGVFLGDGAGGLALADSFEGREFQGRVLAVGDFNHDGYVDLVVDFGPTEVLVVFGSADGFVRYDRYQVLEDFAGIAVVDVNMDGHLDIVLNGSTDDESAGVVMLMLGSADGTFHTDAFTLALGAIVVADVNGDGLPDIAAYDSTSVHVLVNERNDVNHAPVVTSYSVTSGYPCATLSAQATDADQQLFVVDWFDASGAELFSGSGKNTSLSVCVDRPDTYVYRRIVTDGHGGTASGTVTFTYQVTLKEIVLYAAASDVEMAGNWSRVADSTAAGGFRAYDRNLGAPKVTQPSPAPANAITIPFLADPNLSYKLWVRLKADANSWANDSVWVQFSSAAAAPYIAGTSVGLAVSLEECVNCGVAGWGWQDDGYGAVNKNGILLRFDAGPQTIVIQTREDGVSIDQVVLSAEKYLTMRPGTAKNDRTILPAMPAQK
jgi:hypothetical protein